MTRDKHPLQLPEPARPYRPVFWITEHQRVYPLTAAHHNKATRRDGAR